MNGPGVTPISESGLARKSPEPRVRQWPRRCLQARSPSRRDRCPLGDPGKQKADSTTRKAGDRRRADPAHGRRGEERRFAQPLNDREKHRGQKNTEQRHTHHAAEHGNSQRPPHLGPGPGGHSKRDHADDERKRGHEDRPQPQLARLQRRLIARQAFQVLLLGVLDDQDRVFARQADQHDQANLYENVDIAARVQHAEQRTEQTHRHDHDHGKWKSPALVQGGQGQEDTHDRQRKNVNRGVARPDLKEHDLGPLRFHRQRQGLVGQVVDVLDGIPGADACGQAPGDLRRRVKVVARNGNRTADLAHADQRSQRNHLPPLVADLEQIDVFDLIAKIALQLDSDLPVPAKLVEAVHVQGAQAHSQGLIDIVKRQAQGLGLGAVDVEVKLRRLRAKLAGRGGESRIALHGRHEIVGLLLEVLQAAAAAVFDNQLVAAGNTEARDRRRVTYRHDRILHPPPELFPQPVHDVIGIKPGSLTLIKRVKDNKHRPEVGSVGL